MIRKSIRIIASAALAALLLGVTTAFAKSFSSLGDPLPGGSDIEVVGISGDGLSITGNSITNDSGAPLGRQPFIWTKAAGIVGLGSLSGSISTIAGQISRNGAVVAGTSYTGRNNLGGPFYRQGFRWAPDTGIVAIPFLGPPPYGQVAQNSLIGTSRDGSVLAGTDDTVGMAIRWTQETGPVALGRFPADDFSVAYGISGDGKAISGQSIRVGLIRGFRWTQAEGMIELGFIPGASEMDQPMISENGQAVAATCYFASTDNGQASRWTQSTGVVGLGYLPNQNHSFAEMISADGSVVVGYGQENWWSDSRQVIRWTQATGMVGLGWLPGGGKYSQPTAMSRDGSVILGLGDSANGLQVFIWTPQEGMRVLSDVLINDYGLNLAGWTLTSATIAGNGAVLAGNGTNPSGQKAGWVADLRPGH